MTYTRDNDAENDVGRGVILYDGACDVCSATAGRVHRMLERRSFILLPLQSPLAQKLSGASAEQLLTEIHVVTADRQVLRGVDALLYVARTLPWARPICAITLLPGVMPLARLVYRFIAANRYRTQGICSIAERDSRWPRWIVPLLIAAVTCLLAPTLEPWACMWTTALAVFATAKWITWWPHRRVGSKVRTLAYFVAWTGMDAKRFLDPRRCSETVARRDWIEAALKLLVGIALLTVTRGLRDEPIVAGWLGMLGLILILHFGLFHLLALTWQATGVDAKPLMDRPIRSRSLGELWGRRWNSGFNALAERTLFNPLSKRRGATFATACVFLASGLVHDLVISVPARGGYGGPTLYFLIQLIGLLIERTPVMRRLGRGALGRIFTCLFALAPLPLLFHEPFIRRVVVPFLHAIGVLP